MNRNEFLYAYVMQRAGAIAGSVTAEKLVASAAKVWQELQYETGAEERPALTIEGIGADHDEDGVEIGQ